LALLLDTHFVFGLVGAPMWLSRAQERFLEDHEDPFVVSAVSLWEIRLKWNAFSRVGARKGPAGPEEVLEVLRNRQVVLLSLKPEHAAATLSVPLAHKDPFDELLLVQAQVEGHQLLTRDKLLRNHPLAQAI